MSDKDWKKQYSQILQQLEDKESAWEELETLLRKAISRLSISAKGMDQQLDQCLQNIQNSSRDKDDGKLASALEELSKIMSRLDDFTKHGETGTTSASTDIHAQLLQLINHLQLDASDQAALEDFKSSLSALDTDQCIQQLADLINTQLDAETIAGPIQQVLITLIEKFSFSHGGSEQLNNIKDRLESDFDSESWHAYLDQSIEEIRITISSLSNEKIELESLIVDVTRQLSEISGVLSEEHSASQQGRKETHNLQELMNESVLSIENSVQQESDIDALKSHINENLDKIKRGVEEFVEKDNQRFEDSESRIVVLQQQIKFMDHESQQLKLKLSDNRQKLMFDSLTGARSRLSYEEILDQEFSRWERYREAFCYAIFDIDHFKHVNDRFGHNAGDKALQIVANLMSKHIRKTDFLFRIGGEEFVLLLPKTGLQHAKPLAEKIRSSVGKSNFHFKQEQLQLTLSGGLTMVLPLDTPEFLYERADKALYEAKQSGRDQLVVLKD